MNEFTATFARLRGLLEPFEERLVVKHDRADVYYLDTRHLEQWKKELFFGGVQIRKTYVAYYLFPVYVFPELLDDVSPELKRRMQGKSCFNFRSIDDALLGELKRLTERGFDRYRKEGFV